MEALSRVGSWLSARLSALRERLPGGPYSDSDLGDKIRSVMFWALLAVIMVLAAGYGVVLLNEVQSGGGGTAQVLAFRAAPASAGSTSNVSLCASDIDLDEGTSTILKFDAKPLEGYELTAVELKPASSNAPQGVVEAKAQDRLSILLAAGQTDEEPNPAAVYGLSVVYSKGDAQVTSRCNVKLVTAAPAAPGEEPTPPPEPRVIRARVVPPQQPVAEVAGESQGPPAAEAPTYPPGTLGIIALTPSNTAGPTRTPGPSTTPNPSATVAPTQVPTQVPTEVPTQIPTEVPTEVPTQVPTEVPTQVPTEVPTQVPTEVPTQVPTEEPTQVPTEAPTQVPTEEPTVALPTVTLPTVEPPGPTPEGEGGEAGLIGELIGILLSG